VFLDRERRQVWALRRQDGEPVYLPVGQAKAMRAYAKESLRCPYPGCEVPITTSGGSRRDHFRHLTPAVHPGGMESEFHLAAKAMIAAWLREQVPDGVLVREEQTVKDPATALHRRPDVLVTGRSGRRVAYEVEYKSWSIDAWRAKQRDLDGAGAGGIRTLWLIGHTRMRLAFGSEAVVVGPEIVTAMREAHCPVLVVNPVTREVGTLESLDGDLHGPGPFLLHVEPLEDCRFDERCGIMTSRLRYLLEREAATRQRQRLEAEARLARERADRARHRPSPIEQDEQDEARSDKHRRHRRRPDDVEVWLSLFPNARTIPQRQADGTVRYVPRPSKS
jgi:hypothetical protein